MKKILLLFLFVSSLAFSQNETIGLYEFSYEKLPENNLLKKNEVWYQLMKDTYVMSFSKSPIGIKRAIEKMKIVLEKNQFEFKSPTIDKSYISDIVESIYDYEILNITIQNESSEIKNIWANKEYLFIITLDKDKYTISIMKRI